MHAREGHNGQIRHANHEPGRSRPLTKRQPIKFATDENIEKHFVGDFWSGRKTAAYLGYEGRGRGLGNGFGLGTPVVS
jgi:hypothetical protein